jgi:transposase-like protein
VDSGRETGSDQSGWDDVGGTSPGVQQLQKENARLRREVDYLKKAGAFFRELDQGKRTSR